MMLHYAYYIATHQAMVKKSSWISTVEKYIAVDSACFQISAKIIEVNDETIECISTRHLSS